ncbi:MAG: hypothetical protein AB1333_04285 [Patescibacteria group bacterium]
MVFVAFEGPSGGGKSTAIESLKKIFEQRGFRIGVVDTDSGTYCHTLQRVAKKFFAHSSLRNFIFWIIRFKEAKAIREMNKEDYDIIFADRYAGTSVVFSLCSKVPKGIVMWFYSRIKPKPDITFFFDTSLKETRKRKLSETNKKGMNSLSLKTIRMYRKVAKDFKWKWINASQNEGMVVSDCIAFIFERMKK